jgi:ubiquitin-like 1-activating enzyme E1 B
MLRRKNYPRDAPPFILPSPLPKPSKLKMAPQQPETPPRVNLKRGLRVDDDEIIDLAPTPKRPRVNTNVNGAPSVGPSPSKKRRLEEDGLILMEGANDQLADDIIEID